MAMDLSDHRVKREIDRFPPATGEFLAHQGLRRQLEYGANVEMFPASPPGPVDRQEQSPQRRPEMPQ